MARTIEELKALAEKHRIDNYETMSYNELSHAVADAERIKNDSEEIKKLKEELALERNKLKKMKVQYEGVDDGRTPTHDELMNLPIIVAPHIPDMGKPNAPKYTFEEELGQDVHYVERNFVKEGIPEGMKPGEENIPLQFEHQGYKKNKVKSTTAGPTSNAGISLLPGEQWLTVFDKNRIGYLWADVMPYLKAIHDGYYYDKYIDKITKAQIMIDHRYAVPKHIIDSIFIDIAKAEKKREIEDRRFEKLLMEE